MKGFMKYFLASFLAIFVALLLILLIGLGSLSALISSKPEEVKLKPGTVLVLDLKQRITDRTITSPFEFSGLGTLGLEGSLGLYDVVKNLEKASTDPNISGVLIRTGLQSNGIATLDEIREALKIFKESGKFVYAHADMYTQGSYYLASVADKVFLNPEGILEFRGLRSDVIFYKKALEKIGVDVQIIRQGRFKAAVEPFQQQSMSPENKEQTMTFLNAAWTRMLAGISEGRNKTTEELNGLADSWEARSPASALDLGLVDSLLYEDQVQELLLNKTGLGEKEKLRTISISRYTLATNPVREEYTPDRIAVIYGTGSIGMESTGSLSIGTDLAKAFDKARRDNKVKAIVFRVNSPGGDALASEIIRREVELAAAEKPLIISMGDLAASGGYWISAPGTKIVAGHTTLTGSIGAFGMIPNMEKLMTDKIGITFDGVQTNELAGAGSIFRPMTETEKAVFMDQLRMTYNNFLSHVSKTRNMSTEEVDRIGEGRIWSGIVARELGLVDEIGGIRDAILLAASEANLKTWRIREMPALKDPLNQIIESVLGRSSPSESVLARQVPAFRDLQDIIRGGRMQARLPYRLEVY